MACGLPACPALPNRGDRILLIPRCRPNSCEMPGAIIAAAAGQLQRGLDARANLRKKEATSFDRRPLPIKYTSSTQFSGSTLHLRSTKRSTHEDEDVSVLSVLMISAMLSRACGGASTADQAPVHRRVGSCSPHGSARAHLRQQPLRGRGVIEPSPRAVDIICCPSSWAMRLRRGQPAPKRPKGAPERGNSPTSPPRTIRRRPDRNRHQRTHPGRQGPHDLQQRRRSARPRG